MKPCIRCQQPLPLDQFYKHSQMADGHLNKCKECCKKDANTHRGEHIEEVREYDRQRGSLPHRVAARIAYQRTERGTAASRRAKTAHYYRYPRRSAARTLFSNAVRDGKIQAQKICSRCGAEPAQGHHENYDSPLQVIWLCSKCHALRHKEMRKEGIQP